ncbi:type II toxin-antitoxin system RelE/ParE family toxin [Deferrisoma camini]|uniref:type II toxin-antitoxin system RelE/ParE family toxin n=1 Tax=Deferrisoma camini TaxID=1035120 RepID=UPI00046CD6BC|nr:type II toxin-antitoxin system RelE/ParE family toxin [Deferrisoma camini]
MRLITVRKGRHRVCAIAADTGRCDLEDFFAELEKGRSADLNGLLDLIERVSVGGRPSETQYCKHLGGGIWEFRHGRARILWFYDDEAGSLILCSHGFVKQSQKTPRPEIDRAKTRRKRYLEAKKGGTLARDWEETP